MEITEIDELLARYTAAESRIAANLLELDDHPTYELITSGALTGATRARVEAEAAEAGSLWTGLDALRQTLSRGRQIRADGRVSRDDRTQLEEILLGESVLMGVVQTPLAERDLLAGGSVERRLTIEALLGELRQVYEPLRDAVAGIDAVWRDVLPRLDAAQTTLGELRGEMSELGASESTVSAAEAQLDELRRVVMDDPLSLDTGAGQRLDQAVAAAARGVGRLRHAHDALDADLARTEELVAEARSLRSRAAVAMSDTIAKILDPGDLVQVPDNTTVDELARRGAVLRADSDRPWQQRRAKLDQWLATTETFVAQLSQAEKRNRAPLETRDELRGLLSAYRAKAAAVGVIERADLSDLAEEAHNELFTAPTDLTRAEALVSRLGTAIASKP